MKNRLKILIITHYFPPLNSIASHRPYSWAKYWSKMGHEVTVLTTTKKERDNNLNLPFEGFKLIEVKNNVLESLIKISKYGKLSPKSPQNNVNLELNNKKNFLNTFLSKLEYTAKKISAKSGCFINDARLPVIFDFWYLNVIKNYFNKIDENFDVVVSTYAPYVTHLLALKLIKIKRAKFWVADYRDLWTQHSLYPGLFPFTIIEETLEKKVNKTADLITTVSEPLANQIKSKYKIKNVEVIYNGFDEEVLENIDPYPIWSDNKVRIVYTGTIYKGTRDPSPLFTAIKELEASGYRHLLQNLEVIFVGGYKANLDALIEHFQVNKYVKYLGFVKHKDSLKMQRDAHVLLFLEFNSEKIDGIFTGKLFEYLFSGTQIWAVGVEENTSVGKLIQESRCGICFGKNVELIKSHLIKLLKSGKKPLINPNLELLHNFSRKKQAEKLINLVLQKFSPMY